MLDSALHIEKRGAYCTVEMTNGNNGINSIVQEFTAQLTALIERETQARMQASVLAALGAPVRRGPGRPPKNGLAVFSVSGRGSRPKQFCPVPGCKNVAAPVFGMVCSTHKNLPKAKIKEYREARRKARSQSKASLGAAPRKKVRATPKVLKARKLQGQYMGALRTLTGGARARVKAVAKDKGVSEALRLAQSLKKAA